MTFDLADSLLIVSIGSCAYLALVRLWLGFPARGPSAWAGVWALLAVAFASARFVQLHAAAAEPAIAAARLYGACSPLLVTALVAFTRELSETRGRRGRVGPPAAIAISAVMLFTPWFVSDRVVNSVSLSGQPYLGVEGGPGMPLVGLLLAAGLSWCVAMIVRSPALPAKDKRLLGATLAIYSAMGASTLASSLSWLPTAGLGEYGPLLVTMSTSVLLARRQGRLERELHAQIAARTRNLRESEQRLRRVIEHAPIGFLTVDAQGQLDHANAALLAMLGSTREQFASAFSVTDEENAKRSGFSAMFARALAEGVALSAEFEFDTWWGRRLTTHTTISPYRDAAGAVAGALAIVEDITEQRGIEKRLQRAQRLEAVGQLAAGIAHEINNPMAYVRSNLSVLGEELSALEKAFSESDSPASAEARARVRSLEQHRAASLASVQRTVTIVRDLRDFARASGGEREAVDVNAQLEQAARLAAKRDDGLREVELELGDVPRVAIDPGQLRQVMLNLLTHAQQVAGPHGRVRASTAEADGWVLIRVHDDGPPILPPERERLFEPFAIARGAGEPTLGLYVSQQIVREHDGKLEVLSTQGHGTSFVVRLPAVAREASDDPAASG